MDVTDQQPTSGENNGQTRSSDRIGFVTSLVVRTNSGKVFTGETTDVSLTGAFLHTDTAPTDVVAGEPGAAEITVQEGGRDVSMVFPCVVARVTATGLGLDFENEEEEGEEEEGEGPELLNETD